ncbi:leukotriene B4 receptor 1-like isoform X6 [Phycodurus eques]|uniref:leukotriene B4 receptor 1-like isoform X6 n=1 Tax=Phycodurus eques TaxID=693459 RepID=UPI002ACDFDA1|nr:leukotriene B4 receptor 1-like isoform X6 [Phycodurus eques]
MLRGHRSATRTSEDGDERSDPAGRRLLAQHPESLRNRAPMAPANSSVPLKNESIVDSPASTTMGALILSLVFLVGFPGNLFVIWSVMARARKRTITTLLILNLAIADGSLMALTPFFIAYLVMKRWAFGTVMCKVLFYLCLANMYASIYIITLMSLYRLLAVLRPQRISTTVGHRTVTWTVALTWAPVALASAPAVIFRDVRTNADRAICDSYHDEDSHTVIQYMLELVLGFLIPYSIVVVSYICILRRIRQTKFNRRIRSEKLILAIVVTFCVFWLPYHMVNTVQFAAHSGRSQTKRWCPIPPPSRCPSAPQPRSASPS